MLSFQKLEQKKQKRLIILIGVLIILILAGASLFLFQDKLFPQEPPEESQIAPPKSSALSPELNLAIFQDEVFLSLKLHGSLTKDNLVIGRSNPFVP